VILTLLPRYSFIDPGSMKGWVDLSTVSEQLAQNCYATVQIRCQHCSIVAPLSRCEPLAQGRYLAAGWPRLEPATFRSLIRRSSHATLDTTPPGHKPGKLSPRSTISSMMAFRICCFLARDSMLSALYAIARPSVCLSVCPSVRLSVCLSVCHTGGSVKNGWTYHRNSFTIW